jgi:hypothetical protein
MRCLWANGSYFFGKINSLNFGYHEKYSYWRTYMTIFGEWTRRMQYEEVFDARDGSERECNSLVRDRRVRRERSEIWRVLDSQQVKRIK